MRFEFHKVYTYYNYHLIYIYGKRWDSFNYYISVNKQFKNSKFIHTFGFKHLVKSHMPFIGHCVIEIIPSINETFE